jgi:hypothetical protein
LSYYNADHALLAMKKPLRSGYGKRSLAVKNDLSLPGNASRLVACNLNGFGNSQLLYWGGGSDAADGRKAEPGFRVPECCSAKAGTVRKPSGTTDHRL